MGHPGIHGFEPRFGVIGCLSVKDLASARELVEEDAKAQVRDGGACAVLHRPRRGDANHVGISYSPGGPDEGQARILRAVQRPRVLPRRGAHGAHEGVPRGAHRGVGDREMVDYLGGFRGECLHMERCHASGKPVYCIHGTAKAKDAECAKKFVEIIKAQLSTSLFVMRATIFPPGGDIPPEFQDQVTLHWVAQWAGSANHELHNKHCEDSGEEMRELVEDISIIEYADALTTPRPSLTKVSRDQRHQGRAQVHTS